MAILHTQINPRSAEFADNSTAMLEQVQALRSLLAQICQGGGAKAQERHTARVSCCRGSVSTACSTLARRFLKSANWPLTRCTAKTCPPLA